MKHPKDTIYHGGLRISALLLAFLLLFDSGILFPITKKLSSNTQQYVATVVGVGAAVLPTELNSLTAQLSARNRELDAREAYIAEREISVGLSDRDTNTKIDFSTYILSVLLFIILVLIVLNYALDFAREKHFRVVNQA